MTRAETGKVLAILKAAYPRQDIPPETVAVYADMLSDLDGDAVATAARAHIATSPFFPSVSELRRRALPPALQPEVAWGEVMHKIASVGRYRIPAWSSPAIEATVNAIGWQELCGSENLSVERAHFFRTYAAFQGQATERTNLDGIEAQRKPLPFLTDGDA